MCSLHTLTIDIQVVLCKYFRALVNGLTGSVEDTTQHVLRDGQPHAAAGELNVRRLHVDAGSTFEDLDDSLLALDFKHLTTTLGPVWQRELYNFIV